MTLRSSLLCSIAMSTTLLSLPAFAQGGIEVVTVTAAKREQNVQNVPIAMNVLSQKDIERYGSSDLKDIAKLVPGLRIQSGQGVNAMFLRGFGTNAAVNPALEQTVTLYVDGVYSGRAREYMAPVFDVTRIEVLRGPQGALLGKNTSAGALSITTNGPTDTFEAGATVGYAIDRAKGVDATGYISGPITDTLKARLALKIVDQSGWLRNQNTGGTPFNAPQTESQQGRLTLVFEPSANFKMTTKYGFDHTAADGRLMTGVPLATLRNQLPGFFQDAPALAGGSADLDRSNSHHFGNNIEIGLGDLTLVSQSGISAFTSRSLATGRHFPPESVNTDYTDSFKQFMQEFRLLSPEDQTFSWLVGVYGDYSTYNVTNVFTLNTASAPFYLKSSWYTFSGYATGTWNITDDFRLIGGVRGTTIEREGNYNRPGTGGLVIPNQTRTESSFDPSITAQYDITPDINVYATWSKGSKAGAFQATRGTALADFYLKPETSTSYDIGMKSQLWDFVTFNVSAFITKFKNLQVSSFVTISGVPTLLANNAEAESKGAEVVLNANLDEWIEGFSFDFSGSYVDVRYTDYPGAACTFAQLPPLGTCNGVFITPGVLNNAKGQWVATGVPMWSGSLNVHYTRDLNDWLKFEGDIGANMESKSPLDRTFIPGISMQPGNTKINFRAGFGAPDDAWNVSVIGTNIFDVLTTASRYSFGTVSVFAIEEGRRITIQGSVKL